MWDIAAILGGVVAVLAIAGWAASKLVGFGKDKAENTEHEAREAGHEQTAKAREEWNAADPFAGTDPSVPDDTEN